jgi:membrane protein implicated in regulation of membrane protease activity
MEPSTIWWVMAGITVAAELLIGSFYLLMLSLGMAAGAIAAQAGSPLTVQMVVAAGVGGAAVLLWRRVKQGRGAELEAQSNPNVNLDIGALVMVQAWASDGSAQVHYRGANWTALHRPGLAPESGEHRVVEVQGSRLVLEKT